MDKYAANGFSREMEFRDRSELMNEIYRKGARRYMEGLDLQDAFRHTWRVSCMDEGTPNGDIRLPGSGILYDDKKMMKILGSAAEEALLEGKELVLTSHYGCGAGALKAQRLGRPATEGDYIASAIIKACAARLGLRHSHIGKDSLKRPESHHISRIVYIDNVGHFSPATTEGMPPGFVLSRKYIDNRDLAAYTKIALDIAMDKGHGFGEFISDDEPIVVIPMARNGASASKMTDAIAPTVKELNSAMERENVIIDPVVIQI